jgi:spore coat polysaccharide biosynthesis protein SpsF
MDSVCTVILARIGSSRLPKKMIKQFGEKTILDFILNRARNLDNWPNVILATTDLDQDDELEKIARSHNIDTHRGSVDDVAKRFIEASNLTDCKWIGRVNGDNIFFDYEKINYAASLIKKLPDIDLISNVNNTHNPGFSVEIVSKNTITESYKKMNTFEKEHVTSYMYKNLSEFKVHFIQNRKNLESLAIDTDEDYLRALEFTKEPHCFNFNTPVSKILKHNKANK